MEKGQRKMFMEETIKRLIDIAKSIAKIYQTILNEGRMTEYISQLQLVLEVEKKIKFLN